jgi:nucleoside phosphorylase
MKPLITVAVPEEISSYLHSKVHFTGIGVINTLLSLSGLTFKPSVIYNIGTCVSKYPHEHIPVEFSHFISAVKSFPHDIISFSDNYDDINVIKSSDFLETHSEFVTSPHQMSSSYGDMEAYAQAAFCKRHSIPFRCIKVVSDCAQSTSQSHWEEQLKITRPILDMLIEKILSH